MSLEMWQELKALRKRVEQLEANRKSAEDLTPINEELTRMNGEIKAMKMRMGKNAKAE